MEEKRKRDHKITFWVTSDEWHTIRKKMYLSHTRNMSAYLRKMAIDGCIIFTDTSYLKKQFEEMHKIGVNLNQIAKQLNTTGTSKGSVMEYVQRMVKQIWHILKSSQLKLQ